MGILKIKNSSGQWIDIPAIKGADGKDGDVTLEQLNKITGKLENLTTEDKSNLVNAVNEVVSKTNIDDGPIYSIFVDSSVSYGYYMANREDGTNVEILDIFGNLFTKIASGERNYFVVHLYNLYKSGNSQGWWTGAFYRKTDFKQSSTFGFYFNKTQGNLACFNVSINGVWENNIFTVNSIKYSTAINSFEMGPIYIKSNGAQNITGVKTFTVLPESSVVPTSNKQLVNKAYIDSLLEDVDIPVLHNQIINIGSANLDGNIEAGVYKLTGASTKIYYNTAKYVSPCFWDDEVCLLFVSTCRSYQSGILFKGYYDGMRVYNLSPSGYKYFLLGDTLTTTGTETISGKKTFTSLPETSVLATEDSQFVNKKYVDDAIANAITAILESEY